MSYAVLADLVARVGDTELRQIADRDRDLIPDQDVIDAAIADADNLINGYVGTRYQVPLASVPDLVRTWSVSIARYILHRNGAPDHVAQDYKDAISGLKDVAGGRLALPIASGGTPPAANTGQVNSAHPAEVFTPERLRGW